ncbi:MAG: hypothetical protein ACLPV4_06380 [Solirubrobacteraceae bacterium]
MLTDDPIMALERQLVGAGFVAVTAAVLVALAVAAGALALLGGRSQPLKPSVSATPSSRAQLVGLLAVLRRPQTKADLSLPGLDRPRTVVQSPFGTPDRSLVRLAAVAPWGANIYLVPFKPPSGRALIHVRGFLRRYAARVESIGIVARGVHGGHGLTVWDVEHGMAHTNIPPPPGGGRLRLVAIVPDGVAHVALGFAAGALIETAAVHGNVAGFEVSPRPTGRLALLWFSRTGQMVKRIVLP